MSSHETAERGVPENAAVIGSGTDTADRNNLGSGTQPLHPGQLVQARFRGVVHWTGTVETVSVALGVVWILEDGLGERKLLDLREYQVGPQESADP